MEKIQGNFVLLLALFISTFASSYGQTLQLISVSSRAICSGTSLEVNFLRTEGAMDTTELVIQLSDDKGSFADPELIGVGSSSPLSGYIPWGTSSSDLYKIRIKERWGNYHSNESETIAITIRPDAPKGPSVYTMCFGDEPITFSAEGENLKWYYNPYQYTLTPPTPSTTEPISKGLLGPTYWVSQTVNGCESERMSIVYANFLYAITPTFTPPGPVCQNSVVDGSILANAVHGYNSSEFFWSENGDWESYGSREVPIPNTSVPGTKDYYVSVNHVKQCTSEKAKITLTVLPAPPAPQVTNLSYNVGDVAQPLSATGEQGATLIWYDSPTSDVQLNYAPIPSTWQAGTTIYHVAQLLNGCMSPRAELVVTVTECAKPPMPTGRNHYALCTGDQPVTLSASGQNLKWYRFESPSPQGALDGPPTIDTEGYYYLPFVYCVTQTIDGCTSDPMIILVTLFSYAPPPSVTSPEPVCQYSSVDASILTNSIFNYGPSGIGYYWSEDSSQTVPGTIEIPIPSTSTPGTKDYYVAQNMSKTCTGPKSKITVTVLPTPNKPIVENVNYTVGATPRSLVASGENGAIFKWYDVASGGVPLTGVPVPPTQETSVKSYYVSQTIGECESERAELVVTVAECPKPTPPTGQQGYLLCEGDPAVTLSATGENLKWYNPHPQNQLPGAPAVQTNYLVLPLVYYVTQTVNGCESEPMPIVISVYRYAPKPTITNPAPICQNSDISNEVLLDAIGNRADIPIFYWSLNNNPADAGEGIPAISTAVPGSYDYYVSQSGYRACRSEKERITITVLPTPPAPTVHNVSYIVGAAASRLTAETQNGAVLKWYESVSTSSPLPEAPVPSTQQVGTRSYFVSQSLGNCEGPRAELVVTVSDCVKPPIPSGGGRYTLCTGDQPVTLSASGQNLKWYSGESPNPQNPLAGPPTITTEYSFVSPFVYSVTQTIDGCESDPLVIVITIFSYAPAPTVTSPAPVCQYSTIDGSLLLNSISGYYPGAGGYYWSEDSSPAIFGSSMVPTPSTSTPGTKDYYVSQDLSKTCAGPKAKITITVLPTPNRPSVQNVNYLVGASPTSLTASGENGAVFKWYDVPTGGVALPGVPVPSTQTPGVKSYYVSQTIGDCESERAELVVTVMACVPPPPPTISVLSMVYCQFANAQPLSANGVTGAVLQWYGKNASGGVASAEASVPITQQVGADYYYVSQTLNGCTSERARIEVVVTATAKPTVESPVVFCENSVAQPLSAVGTNLKWYADSQSQGVTTPIVPATNLVGSRSYFVTQTDGNSCESPKAEIVVDVKPQATATISGSTTIGLGKTAVLTVSFTGEAPWRFVLSNGVTVTTPNSPVQVLVTPGSTTDYTLNEVSNSCGLGRVEGNALVTVDLPILETGVLTTAEECAGKSILVPFTRVGEFPAASTFAVQIARESGTRTFFSIPSFTDNQLIRAELPDSLSGGNYFVRVVSRGSQGDVQVVGRVSPTVLLLNALPTATIAGDYRAYAGERVEVEVKLTGKSPWTFSLTQGEGDSLVSSSTSPAYISVLPRFSGAYWLTSVFNQCGIGSVSGRANVVIDPILGDNSIPSHGGVKIFPTVVESICRIEVGSIVDQDAQIELFDSRGVLLSRQGIYQITTELFMQSSPSGVYIISVRNGNYRLVTRVIKR